MIFELFYFDCMVLCIFGMGDVVSLVEKVQEHFDVDEAEQMHEKACNYVRNRLLI